MSDAQKRILERLERAYGPVLDALSEIELFAAELEIFGSARQAKQVRGTPVWRRYLVLHLARLNGEVDDLIELYGDELAELLGLRRAGEEDL